jgi:hypothetical protein
VVQFGIFIPSSFLGRVIPSGAVVQAERGISQVTNVLVRETPRRAGENAVLGETPQREEPSFQTAFFLALAACGNLIRP